ncbi:signal transduction histidine kinase [Kineococcus xinjiangensis]|uniref:histidine kinase n=1 Tax=Kineococcus xinjiangensis TaxID=512762 RepID=A0A2S6IUY5_9ACTN|nr:histidine kinase [Kineococcus xinjiangensis]PPK98087.1 signal transduction histidine kinase [Kineococcus xinjiangensis]
MEPAAPPRPVAPGAAAPVCTATALDATAAAPRGPHAGAHAVVRPDAHPGQRRVWGMPPGRAERVRDLLAILVSILGAVLNTGLVLDELGDRATPPWLVPALFIGIASSAAMWWRRRYPVQVTVAMGALTLVSFADSALLIALLTLAVRRRDRVLAVLSVLAVPVLMLNAWWLQGMRLVESVFLTPVLVGLFVSLGAYIGARRALVDSLRERAERAEAEQSLRAEQARLAERTRIAREMHDVLAHRISLVALHAGGLEVRPDMGAEQVEATAATIRATSRAALEDLRRVLGVLRTGAPSDSAAGAAELAPQPTFVDIQHLVADSRAAGVDVELRTEVSLHTQVPPELGRTVYRIVQEALTNVHKHARSAQALVTLGGRPGSFLCVEIVNGRPAGGAPLLPGSGSGLVGLSERVGIADGTLVSGPEPGGGFAVRARLPWPTPDGAEAADAPTWAPPDARIVTPQRLSPGDE